VFVNGNIDYNEVTTVDIGNLNVTMSAVLNGPNIQLLSNVGSNNYNVKAIAHYL
jgi:hypothetical protein